MSYPPQGVQATGVISAVTLADVISGEDKVVAESTGNARGLNAVDLQTARTADTQVASGSRSTIAGGYRNTNSGVQATVGGGALNTLASSYNGTISGGYQNVMGGNSHASSILGGNANTVTALANYSSIGGGQSNLIGSDADWATIGGGDDNEASANHATVPGGDTCVADGVASFATGLSADTNGHKAAACFSGQGRWAYGLTRPHAGTSAINCEFPFLATTDDASGEVATIDGTLATDVPTGATMMCVLDFHAVEVGDRTKTFSGQRRFVIRNVSGTAALDGAVDTIGTDENSTGGSPTIAVTVSGANMVITCTGIAATDHAWVGTIRALGIIQ